MNESLVKMLHDFKEMIENNADRGDGSDDDADSVNSSVGD